MELSSIVQPSRHSSFKIVGGNRRIVDDVCYTLLRARWEYFFAMILSAFTCFNLVFAAFYCIDPDGLSDGDGSFREAFYFSIQTFSTIGYGRLSPVSPYVDAIVAVQAMISLIFIGVVGGLSFARVMRPSSRLVFARVACVAELNGVPTLRIRVCNERAHNTIFHATFYLTASFERVSREGHQMRVQRQLRLIQDTVPCFGATFTVCHAIDHNSPLHGLDESSIASKIHTLDLLVGGTDETYVSQVYAHHSYRPEDIRFGHYFTNIIDADTGVMDLSQMHQTTIDPSTASRHEFYVGRRKSTISRLTHDALSQLTRTNSGKIGTMSTNLVVQSGPSKSSANGTMDQMPESVPECAPGAPRFASNQVHDARTIMARDQTSRDATVMALQSTPVTAEAL